MAAKNKLKIIILNIMNAKKMTNKQITVDDILNATISSDRELDKFLDANSEKLKLIIKITGDDYHGTIPASFAESLVEIQKNFYKSVAYALYGKDDIRKLTKQNIKDYELVFKINPGSTEIISQLLNSVKELAEKVMDGMDAKSKAIFIMAVISLIGGIYLSSQFINELGQIERAKISKEQLDAQEKTKQLEEQEETKRLEAALNSSRGTLPTPVQIIEHTAETSADSRAAILRGAKTATGVTIGKQQFNESDIQEATQRADRGQMTARIETDIYQIVISNFRDTDILRFTLSDKQGKEISAAFDTNDLDADSQELLWQAAKNRSFLRITLNKTYVGDNLKDAYIKQVDLINSPN